MGLLLAAGDSVEDAERVREAMQLAGRAGSVCGHIAVGVPSAWLAGVDEGVVMPLDLVVTVGLPRGLSDPICFGDMALKWSLNALSTGAQVIKGMVYSNRMINVGVLNNKLYFRSIALVAMLVGCSKALAEQCLLRAIYSDCMPEGSPAISDHIRAATHRANVVPIAMLVAGGCCVLVGDAEQALAETPVLRNLIASSCVQAVEPLRYTVTASIGGVDQNAPMEGGTCGSYIHWLRDE